MRSKFLFYLAIVLFASCAAFAQSTNKTIVLVRHAEKAPARDDDKGDPDLSEDGKQRAIRLADAIRRYKPHEIFSSEYNRSKQTAEPIAKRRGKAIQIYDPAKQPDLVVKILASNTDHYLIVGHSNTIPALANLLMKKEIFKQLPDVEYGVFWVIRMKRGVVTKTEVFTY